MKHIVTWLRPSDGAQLHGGEYESEELAHEALVEWAHELVTDEGHDGTGFLLVTTEDGRVVERLTFDEALSKRFEIWIDGEQDIAVVADSAEDALRQFIDNEDFAEPSPDDGTWEYVVDARQHGELLATETVVVQPEEPECTADEHDWRSPHELVGGLEENPGVFGHGGGVIIREVCRNCGMYRTTDTWGSRPPQPREEVAYRNADEDSRAWIAAQDRADFIEAHEDAGDGPFAIIDDQELQVFGVGETIADAYDHAASVVIFDDDWTLVPCTQELHEYVRDFGPPRVTDWEVRDGVARLINSEEGAA